MYRLIVLVEPLSASEWCWPGKIGRITSVGATGASMWTASTDYIMGRIKVEWTGPHLFPEYLDDLQNSLSLGGVRMAGI